MGDIDVESTRLTAFIKFHTSADMHPSPSTFHSHLLVRL